MCGHGNTMKISANGVSIEVDDQGLASGPPVNKAQCAMTTSVVTPASGKTRLFPWSIPL